MLRELDTQKRHTVSSVENGCVSHENGSMRILSPGSRKIDPVGSNGHRGLPPTIAAVQPPQTVVQHRKLRIKTVGAGLLMSTKSPNIFTVQT